MRLSPAQSPQLAPARHSRLNSRCGGAVAARRRTAACASASGASQQPQPQQLQQQAQPQQQLWPQLLQAIAAADKWQPPAQQVVCGGEGDTLQQALRALETAVEQEDYRAAAQLRDASLNWLAGWWRPAVSACLLHVQHSEPHRWSATIFTPVDILNYDLYNNCVLRELDMSELLASAPRYGTPLFEAHCVKGAADGSYASVVVALQSCNRAFSELLRVQEVGSRGRVATEPGAPRFTNQRLLLLLQPDRASVAAVHAGQHSTLWTWSSQLSGAAASSSSIHGPHRPAERSGALRVGLTVDGNHLDLLRGPGSILRTAPDAFTFARHALPAGVLGSFSDGSDDASNWFGAAGSVSARLFRVDLQYRLPPDEQPLTESEAGEASASSSSSSSSSTPGQAAQPTAAAWADRLAADVCQALSQPQQAWASSCPQDQLQATLGALLAAAAAGTSPPGAAVSELQQAARVTEVPLPGGEDAAAAAGSGGSGAGSGSAPVCGFTKVEGSVSIGFGGFEITARLS